MEKESNHKIHEELNNIFINLLGYIGLMSDSAIHANERSGKTIYEKLRICKKHVRDIRNHTTVMNKFLELVDEISKNKHNIRQIVFKNYYKEFWNIFVQKEFMDMLGDYEQTINNEYIKE